MVVRNIANRLGRLGQAPRPGQGLAKAEPIVGGVVGIAGVQQDLGRLGVAMQRQQPDPIFPSVLALEPAMPMRHRQAGGQTRPVLGLVGVVLPHLEGVAIGEIEPGRGLGLFGALGVHPREESPCQGVQREPRFVGQSAHLVLARDPVQAASRGPGP